MVSSSSIFESFRRMMRRRERFSSCRRPSRYFNCSSNDFLEMSPSTLPRSKSGFSSRSCWCSSFQRDRSSKCSSRLRFSTSRPTRARPWLISRCRRRSFSRCSSSSSLAFWRRRSISRCTCARRSSSSPSRLFLRASASASARSFSSLSVSSFFFCSSKERFWLVMASRILRMFSSSFLKRSREPSRLSLSVFSASSKSVSRLIFCSMSASASASRSAFSRRYSSSASSALMRSSSSSMRLSRSATVCSSSVMRSPCVLRFRSSSSRSSCSDASWLSRLVSLSLVSFCCAIILSLSCLDR
mmetsp:Transcript_52280/g.131263  ORF Transcript_52280/g.131263 Transcript_52280/m.131263 type:complete len:300 (+) Transcript_52280:1241-2140(+)